MKKHGQKEKTGEGNPGIAGNEKMLRYVIKKPMDWSSYYLVNKDKKEYIALESYMERSRYVLGKYPVIIHPLVLLTVVGNTLGCGDYFGTDMDMVGKWAWNLIGITMKVPEGYKEIMPTFREVVE